MERPSTLTLSTLTLGTPTLWTPALWTQDRPNHSPLLAASGLKTQMVAGSVPCARPGRGLSYRGESSQPDQHREIHGARLTLVRSSAARCRQITLKRSLSTAARIDHSGMRQLHR